MIVDTVLGGIGFRNHTIPPPTAYGTTWIEDILFVEPETQCVDTNLTVDYALKQNNVSGTVDVGDQVYLADNGGFTELDSGHNWQHLKNSQDDAMLYDRAYTAAWLNNLLSMMYFNITNPDAREVGFKEGPPQPRALYKLQDSGNSSQLSVSLGLRFAGRVDKLAMSLLGEYLPLPIAESTINSTSSPRLYPNPQKITRDHFAQASRFILILDCDKLLIASSIHLSGQC